jgi:hypothetical protein
MVGGFGSLPSLDHGDPADRVILMTSNRKMVTFGRKLIRQKPYLDTNGANVNLDVDYSKCPKCGTPLEPPGTSGGRPRRWCSPGCQRSGEAEMRRINGVLRDLGRKKSWRQINGYDTEQIDEVMAGWQCLYDRLAGVPERGDDD